jgi:ParB/RepB/Spo0J family partition protein
MQTVQNSSIQTSVYRDLPLAQLQESPFNPRKRFQQTSLEELAQSIRAQGVLAPLLVREVEPERFEIVAGSRRYRASQIAGMEQVPVRVVSLSDAEAQLAMAIENLHAKTCIRSKKRVLSRILSVSSTISRRLQRKSVEASGSLPNEFG